MRKVVSSSVLLGGSFFAWSHYKIYAEQKHLSKDLSTSVPSSTLSSVLLDHGYDYRQQIGLMALLDINGIKADSYYKDYQTANTWLKVSTQKLLRRGERWSPENVLLENNLKKQQSRVLKAVDLLGMMSPIKPKADCYKDHIAILPGALESRVKLRISIISEAISEGFFPKKIIASTGYRKLLDSECPLIQAPELRTEANMIFQAWKMKSQENPYLSQLPFEISVAELMPNQVRSTTEDTAHQLMAHPGLSGKQVLVYIEQPYASRFYPIFQSSLQKNDNQVALYAKGLNPENVNLFLFQDEVARRIYFQFPALQQTYQLHDEFEERFFIGGNF